MSKSDSGSNNQQPQQRPSSLSNSDPSTVQEQPKPTTEKKNVFARMFAQAISVNPAPTRAEMLNQEGLSAIRSSAQSNNDSDTDSDHEDDAGNGASVEVKDITPPHLEALQQQQLSVKDEENERKLFTNVEGKIANNNITSSETPKKSTRAPDEILEINCKDELIEINNVRVFRFKEIEFNKFVNCTQLELRKNVIHELEAEFFPESLANRLIYLDLFDNKISRIPKGFFNEFKCLRHLDLSYNQIKHIKHLSCLKETLTDLFLVENKIEKIGHGLRELVNLRQLELGGNSIRSLDGGVFDNLINLEQLWLGKNKIRELGAAFVNLKSLRRLSLQANRLLLVGPETFPERAHLNLAELYLSENGLFKVENVKYLCGLKLLDYSTNAIKEIDSENEVNVKNMPLLEEFWITDCKISDWAEVDKFAQFNETLNVVYFERNPIEEDKRYRDKVFRRLPFLRQIDSWPVVNKQNVEADRAIYRGRDNDKGDIIDNIADDDK